jgi:hypothetical protein
MQPHKSNKPSGATVNWKGRPAYRAYSAYRVATHTTKGLSIPAGFAAHTVVSLLCDLAETDTNEPTRVLQYVSKRPHERTLREQQHARRAQSEAMTSANTIINQQ